MYCISATTDLCKCKFLFSSLGIIVCKLLHFNLLHWNQMESNLVGMFIGWSLRSLCFVCWSEVYKRKKRPKGIKKGVSICMGINYLLFICFFMKMFLILSWRKSLSETCITLTFNYYHFSHKWGGGGNWTNWTF